MKKHLLRSALAILLALSMVACGRTPAPVTTGSATDLTPTDTSGSTTSPADPTSPDPSTPDPTTETPFVWNKQTYEGYTPASGALNVEISDGNGLLWYNFEEAASATVLKTSLSSARDSIKLNATLIPGGGPDGSGAISFNGVDNSVKLNNDFSQTSQITPTTFLHPAFTTLSVSFAFCPDSLSGRQLIYEQGDKNNGLAIGIEDGKLVAAIGAGENSTGTGTVKTISYDLPADSAGKWITAALSYDGSSDGGKAVLYVDGIAVQSATDVGSVIPQTLDAAGLGAAVWGTNALGYSGAYYKGKIDDLRIYSIAIEPVGELEEGAIYLQTAAMKNYYVSIASNKLACRSMVDPATRGWIPTVGLADAEGISFRLTGTDQFLSAVDGKLTLISLSTDANEDAKKAATFYADRSESLPSWGESASTAFFHLYTYDRSAAISSGKTGTLSLTSLDSASDSKRLQATFKATGDQTKVPAGLKGAVYYPSYALNAPQFWKWYDHDIIDRDMQYAAELLGVNSFRIWVSYEYWLEDSAHFEAGFNDFLELADKWGITIMVSLFEGCGDSYDYSSYSTWNRAYRTQSRKTAGWAITSPSADIYNNSSRWNEPKAFVEWFMNHYRNDNRLMAIEIYNEPWGDARTALALWLCEYAVTVQGSVPLTLGTAPSGGHTIPNAVNYGMDLLQYHDNFPANTANFVSNANSRIAQGKLANLPVTCTEVQWVGGPANVNYPVYSNLAPTCEQLMETGVWAPYYWTLMVHPCYLNSYRDNHNMYNGLLNEDGTVNNLKNAQAVAGSKITPGVNTVNPYDSGSYRYQTTFSDDFMDLHGYKWTGGSFSASDGSFAGKGTATANDTDFADFTATVDLKIGSGEAGVLIRAADEKNGYLLTYDPADRKLKIYKLASGELTLLAASNELSLDSGASGVTLTVRAAGENLSIETACGTVSASDGAYKSGLVGLYAAENAVFDNVHVKKTA